MTARRRQVQEEQRGQRTLRSRRSRMPAHACARRPEGDGRLIGSPAATASAPNVRSNGQCRRGGGQQHTGPAITVIARFSIPPTMNQLEVRQFAIIA